MHRIRQCHMCGCLSDTNITNGKGNYNVYDTKSLIMGSEGFGGWPDWMVPFVFQLYSNMVPSKTFVPEPKASRIPICQRCEEKNLLCLDAPGNSCYECNKRSTVCRDWKPEEGQVR